ncbi:hypothetical protein EVG20_g4284 [Dentipellis fragilis]|uniref:CRAL-TRIO domain-containing protein n=1 Tax=Dentipellis fragilis TaxID=205917 RepID=A0A4Y9Z097_9AGAM|nr:hypothetical protein EVG20_g4284 [Dentipellis fragilis]
MPDFTILPPPPLPEGETRPGELTPAQEEMYAKVLAHFDDAEYRLPSEGKSKEEDKEKGELSEDEKFWLSRECLLRYLRATKWHVGQSIERLEGTLKWRHEFGLWDMTPAHVEPECVTGKEIVFGYDTQRRPALYMIPSRQNTTESPRQIEFAVFMLERALDLAGPGVESIVLMINFGDRGKSPTFATSRTVLNILQSHYPERLGAALILNVPFILNAFFKLISPFIDPITRTKMKFNPKAVEDGLFTADELFAQGGWGGAREFEWDHAQYWPSLLKTCAERREKHYARWRELGAKVGVSEWDYKIEGPGAGEAAAVEKPATDEPPAEEQAVAEAEAPVAVEVPVAAVEAPDAAVEGPGAAAEAPTVVSEVQAESKPAVEVEKAT